MVLTGDEVSTEVKEDTGDEVRVGVWGGIDRVGCGAKGQRVLEYKIGGTPGAKDYEYGSALQAPLYMQVLEDDGREMSLGYYRSLKPSKKRIQYGGRIERHKPNYDAALAYALSIPGRIRAGLFETGRASRRERV